MQKVYNGNCNSTCLFDDSSTKNSHHGMRKIMNYLNDCQVYNLDFETMFHIQRALNLTKTQWITYDQTKSSPGQTDLTCEFEYDSEVRKKRNVKNWDDDIEKLQKKLWESNQWFKFHEEMTQLNRDAPGVFKTELLKSEWYLDPKPELESRLIENLEDICTFNGSLTEEGDWDQKNEEYIIFLENIITKFSNDPNCYMDTSSSSQCFDKLRDIGIEEAHGVNYKFNFIQKLAAYEQQCYDKVDGDHPLCDALKANIKCFNRKFESKKSAVHISTSSNEMETWKIILIVVIPIAILIITAALILLYCFKRSLYCFASRGFQGEGLINEPGDDGKVDFSRPKKLDIIDSHLWLKSSSIKWEYSKVLGEGNFGMVVQTKIKPKTKSDGKRSFFTKEKSKTDYITVAMKQQKNQRFNKKEFIDEAYNSYKVILLY